LGIVARQAGLNAISIVLGTITGAINTLLILPKAFEGFEEGWGLIKVLTAYAMIFSQFMHGGIPNAIVRYFPRLQGDARPRFLTLLFLIPLLSSLLFLLILLLAGTAPLNLVNPDDARMLESRSGELFVLTAALTFFFSLNGYLSAVLKTTVFQFLNETFLKTWYLGIAAAYLFNWLSFDQLLIAYVGGYVLATLILLVHALKSGFIARWGNTPLGLPTRELVVFSVYSILDRGASILVQNLDIIMIGLLASLEDVAFYTLAFYIGSVAMIPQKSLLSIANPLASTAIASNDKAALRSIYQSSSLIQTLIGGIIFATIWVSIDEIMLLLPDKFSGGKWVVFYIGLSKLIQMATGVSGGILLYSQLFKLNFRLNLSLIVLTIATNYFFMHPDFLNMGITGAALATAIAFLINNLFKVYHIHRHFAITPYTRALGLSIVLVLLASLGYFWHPYPNEPLKALLVKSSSIGCVMLAVGWRIHPLKNLKALMKKP
jgi:O-antigen/teichoic acid export membrane protein